MTATDSLGALQDLMVDTLLAKAKAGELTPADMKIALDLIKHHKISLDPTVPGNPISLLEEALPFTGEDDSPYN